MFGGSSSQLKSQMAILKKIFSDNAEVHNTKEQMTCSCSIYFPQYLKLPFLKWNLGSLCYGHTGRFKHSPVSSVTDVLRSLISGSALGKVCCYNCVWL